MSENNQPTFVLKDLLDDTNPAAWNQWGDYIDTTFASVTNWDALEPEQMLCGRVFDHALARYRGKVPDEQAHHRAALAVSLVTELAAAGQSFTPGMFEIDNRLTVPVHVSGGIRPDGRAFVIISAEDERDHRGMASREEPFMVETRLARLSSGYAFDLYQAFAEKRDGNERASVVGRGWDDEPTDLSMLDADSLFRTLVCDEHWGVARATDAFMWAMAILQGRPMKRVED